MPIEEDNLINILEKLDFLKLEDTYFDLNRKEKSISIDFKNNRWRYVKIKRYKYNFFENEFCGIVLYNLRSFYFINKFIYSSLNKIDNLYIEYIIFENMFYFVDNTIKGKMETITENDDAFGHFVTQIGNISNILTFFSLKNNLFKLYEDISCINALPMEKQNEKDYETIIMIEIKQKSSSNQVYNKDDYIFLYNYNPLEIELNDIINEINKYEGEFL